MATAIKTTARRSTPMDFLFGLFGVKKGLLHYCRCRTSRGVASRCGHRRNTTDTIEFKKRIWSPSGVRYTALRTQTWKSWVIMLDKRHGFPQWKWHDTKKFVPHRDPVAENSTVHDKFAELHFLYKQLKWWDDTRSCPHALLWGCEPSHASDRLPPTQYP